MESTAQNLRSEKRKKTINLSDEDDLYALFHKLFDC